MSQRCSHDIAIVGGGVAGATLALVLARAGLDVVVFEKQPAHRDRVLGEALAPWGVAEAQTLGVFDVIRPHGVFLDRVAAVEHTGAAGPTTTAENIAGVIPGVAGAFGIGNPALTAAMAKAATAAGATFVWGAQVTGVAPPSVTVAVDATTHEVSARLIVAADGKASPTRRQLAIDLRKHGPHAQCAGMLAENLPDEVPATAVSTAVGDERMSIVFPQGAGRARLYHMFAAGATSPYRGDDRGRRLLDDFADLPMAWGRAVAAATPAGPCATFPIHDGTASAIAVPGAVLIGDAAGYSNPLGAQGLAVCMRDVRVVAELIENGDLSNAPELFAPYVEERTRRMSRLRTFVQLLHLGNIPQPGGAVLRERMRMVSTQEAEVAAVAQTIHLGPHRSPARVFDVPWLESTFGVRLGEQPSIDLAVS